MMALFAAIVVLTAAQVGPEQTPPARPPVLTFPSWAVRPTFAELTPSARAAGIEMGVVQLSCGIGLEGRLDECTALKTSHPNMGFEAVAIEAARTARMSFPSYDGLASNTQIRFEIVLY